MVAKGSKMSEESCRKMSEAHKGKPAWNKGVHSPGPMEGKKHTQETIEKMSIDRSKFSYISLAGGALITYLTGKTFPIVEEFKKHV